MGRLLATGLVKLSHNHKNPLCLEPPANWMRRQAGEESSSKQVVSLVCSAEQTGWILPLVNLRLLSEHGRACQRREYESVSHAVLASGGQSLVGSMQTSRHTVTR